MVIQRRSNREQEAQKWKQDKEDIKAQRLANKQLQNELQAVTPNPKTRSKALVPKKKVVINIESDWEDDEVEMVTPIPGHLGLNYIGLSWISRINGMLKLIMDNMLSRIFSDLGVY
jgi:hypothetical protein